MPKGQRKTGKVYEVKVTLNDIEPLIWRRFRVASDIFLGELHQVLQAVMGWESYHMYQFLIKEQYYGEPFEDMETEDAKKTRLSQVVGRAGAKFMYEYDFGDSWQHEVHIEKALPAEQGEAYPVCVDGRRSCPPEDCGGIWGYAELLEALQDPKHEEHEELMEWVGGGFDPEAFDVDKVNKRLLKLR